MLSYVFAGRSGLQNTSFALLDPSGKKITRGSRSPSQLYETPEKFAEALESTAAKYLEKARPIEALPTLRNLRLALNVAAADMRPLVVIRGSDEANAKELSELIASAAWSEETIGKAHYVVLSEEATLEGLTPDLGVTVVQPDPFGLGGKVLSRAAPKSPQDALTKSLLDGFAKHKAEPREHRDHIREARRKGITWESEIPVTDGHTPQEVALTPEGRFV